MPNQITSHEARLKAVPELREEHTDCQNPPNGYWYNYGDIGYLCNRCGEPKPVESQPKPVTDKPARRQAAKKETS